MKTFIIFHCSKTLVIVYTGSITPGESLSLFKQPEGKKYSDRNIWAISRRKSRCSVISSPIYELVLTRIFGASETIYKTGKNANKR